jgi:homocysteine S-methyltransferase
LGAYANAENVQMESTPTQSKSAEERHWESATEIDEKTYLKEASKWIKEGASIVGGCCRTRPSYIKELSENLKN